MSYDNQILNHKRETKELAKRLLSDEIYHWLNKRGYYPESYVLPPCFQVIKHPETPKKYYSINRKGQYNPELTECIRVHFPKTEYTDRSFGLIHPKIHNDIAYHIAFNWDEIVDAMIPETSQVISYTFSIPINSKTPGRIGLLRTGRLIYEFIEMVDNHIASIAYKYKYIIKADIKNFYPSIYTHSIAWAIHGKCYIRNGNRTNYSLIGNLLDKLFQNANDGCTNGIPIGPVVSDIVAEIIASAVDKELTNKLKDNNIEYQAVRFKDDYRILVNSESHAKKIIKLLQSSLKEYNLELSDEKTKVSLLPNGLFREWVSKYHIIHPKKQKKYSWNEFRELYLSVIEIDKQCPGTGVIDRFLADMINTKGNLKTTLSEYNLERVISMLIMLGTLRIKSFPKVMAILESMLNSFGKNQKKQIVEYLDQYLYSLSNDEDRNKYLISWISYFIVSNDLKSEIKFKPSFQDIITKTVYNNKNNIFNQISDFQLFIGCKKISQKVSMIEHLAIFNPPSINP
ncbi:RNA-directed DNA polymerase [Zooshikella ganghwensis]|uniref:RNA-directed DNA polymerase n=1 Tax=Zooshikella ganghwensis TaxID=202772 RepID=UPI001B7FC6A1|nr:RNA-directed DNA polymerase [Zooshikella ganghwensis]